MNEPTTVLEKLQSAWGRRFISDPARKLLLRQLAEHDWPEEAIETIDASLNFALAYLVPSRLPVEARLVREAVTSAKQSLDQALRQLEAIDALWQQCENYRVALNELYTYQLPTGALNLIHKVLDGEKS